MKIEEEDDRPDPPEADWYWGSLRSACAESNWRKAWAVLAAWPRLPSAEAACLNGPPREQEQPAGVRRAEEYLVKEALSRGELHDALNLRWALDHYQAQPVPPLEYDWEGAAEAPPLGVGYSAGRHVRLGGNASRVIMLSVFGEAGLPLSFRANFDLEEPKMRVLGLHHFEGEHRAIDGSPRFPGVSPTTALSFVTINNRNTAMKMANLLLRAGAGMRNALMALDAARQAPLTADRAWEAWQLMHASWPPTLRDRIRNEGPSLHPNLDFQHNDTPMVPDPALTREWVTKMIELGWWRDDQDLKERRP